MATTGKSSIMHAVQEGLDNLKVTVRDRDTIWTKAVKTTLCKMGRDRFGYKVYARDVVNAYKNGGEWLYDVTWLEHGRERDSLLTDVPLVAECEWGDFKNIVEDFEKLLLARAGVRLMVFNGDYPPRSKEIVKGLAERVGKFNGSCAEDAWLLAAWERSVDDWRFRYFTVDEKNTAIPFPAPVMDPRASTAAARPCGRPSGRGISPAAPAVAARRLP